LDPKITIITACYQSEKTIERLLRSVHSQDYKNIEHIIVDGLSTDSTLEIIKSTNFKYKLLSEKDNGYYDALNKGIAIATGEWIGVLNADDMYASTESLKRLVQFAISSNSDTCFADIAFQDKQGRIFRKVSGKGFNLDWFSKGNMPPHPTFIAKRTLFDKMGRYRTDLRIAGDFDLIARFLWKNSSSWSYFPETVILMNAGGISNAGIKSKIKLNKEIMISCRDLGIKTNYFKVYSKYFTKWLQYFKSEL
jgi:glycosyltransferase involved in cell wall biosynthesis